MTHPLDIAIQEAAKARPEKTEDDFTAFTKLAQLTATCADPTRRKTNLAKIAHTCHRWLAKKNKPTPWEYMKCQSDGMKPWRPSTKHPDDDKNRYCELLGHVSRLRLPLTGMELHHFELFIAVAGANALEWLAHELGKGNTNE